MNRLRISILCFGIYFLITGLWPIIHIKSFIAITGPKYDIWLVKTVGLLITSIGTTSLLALREKTIQFQLIFMCVCSASALTFIDLYYSVKDRILNVYQVDAVIEIILITSMIICWIRRDKHYQ